MRRAGADENNASNKIEKDEGLRNQPSIKNDESKTDIDRNRHCLFLCDF